jgi:EpsI family protein
MVLRIFITSAILLAAAGYRIYAMDAEVTPLRQSLDTLPRQIDRWRGRDDVPFDKEIVDELGVDEYVIRAYQNDREPLISLYVGYYQSQRQGDTIHSPLNCLPGAGWLPVKQDRATIMVRGADGQPQAITVNEFVIQKGLQRQYVLYWYQSHGRVVASEYTSKMYMVADAIRLNRTDAALVRVITPIAGEQPADETGAARRAQEFVRELFPTLTPIIPS